MEFTIRQEVMLKAIADAGKAVSVSSVHPIITGIKISAGQKGLTLISSDFDIFISRFINQTIEVLEIVEIGEIIVPFKHFSELFKRLPKGQVWIKSDGLSIVLKAGDIEVKWKGMNAGDFPELPEMDPDYSISMEEKVLARLFKQTKFAAANQIRNPVLAGVNLIFKDGFLYCAATNSHRLALTKIKINEQQIEGSYIIPGTSVHELLKLLGREDRIIIIHISQQYIRFEAGGLMVYTRLIAGRFPDVHQLVPDHPETEIALNAKLLLMGIERSYFLSSDSHNHNVKLEVKGPSSLMLSAAGPQLGEIIEKQPLLGSSGICRLKITMDGKYLLDALKEIEEENVKFCFYGNLKPIVIRPLENDTYLHVISQICDY
ncbi:DNA polymerase III subunit beta [Bacillus sp. MUM 13]|uniref:DNA polymerase III subunit beta n=1 Tax=Bacillus sp. MUM 13 TaxID=1678001 RepID=UPI0008F5C679|nr:DNA polymerase III subunit beta [Bacillus sp. MUM 13]OIK08690.1 DNA polymerase III subunit beta [Bacillus sp. MUM 13]